MKNIIRVPEFAAALSLGRLLLLATSVCWLSGCQSLSGLVHSPEPVEAPASGGNVMAASLAMNDSPAPAEVVGKSPSSAEMAAIRSRVEASLKRANGNVVVLSIAQSGIPGVYSVRSKDSVKGDYYGVVYMTGDGRYMLQGELLEVTDQGVVAAQDPGTDSMRSVAEQELISTPLDKMVVFAAQGPVKRVIYVFTDVECGYCRKLHQEIDKLNAMGVEVRYLAWPRAGAQSEVAETLRRVWCARDRKVAMTAAKRGNMLEPAPAECKAPIEEQYDLGVRIGVRGTPSVHDAEGRSLGGYMSPEQFKAVLKL